MPSVGAVRSHPLRSRFQGLRNAMLPSKCSTYHDLSNGGPLVVAGMFRTANGVGQAARRMVFELQDRGLDPIPVDLSELFNQVDAHTRIDLKPMPRKRAGTLILIANAPETRLALRALQLRRWHNWRIIGYWSWELETPPKGWLEIAKHLTEIWTPSDFVRSAFEEHLDIPVKTVPIPVGTPAGPETTPPRDDQLRCIAMADGRSSFHRKNLIAAARMFVNAFEPSDKARLTLKIRNGQEFPSFMNELNDILSGHSGVDIINGSIPHKERWKMMSDHNVTLSAHRAEGFGLHMAESMALGKCVIATGWSGNTQYMTKENSVLLPYQLEKVEDPYGVYDTCDQSRWARVDEDAGIEALRHLHRNPDLIRQYGEHARQDVKSSLSGDNLVAALSPSSLALVQEIKPAAHLSTAP